MSHTETTEAVERLVEEFESRYNYLYQGSVYENGGGTFSPVHESLKHWLRTALTTIRNETLEEQQEQNEKALKRSWDKSIEDGTVWDLGSALQALKK